MSIRPQSFLKSTAPLDTVYQVYLALTALAAMTKPHDAVTDEDKSMSALAGLLAQDLGDAYAALLDARPREEAE